MNQNPYRALPAVDELLARARSEPSLSAEAPSLVLSEIRGDLDATRAAIRDQGLDGDAVRDHYQGAIWLERLGRRIAARRQAIYIGAINATGVVLHTGLGRAMLPEAARRAIVDASGYAVLEVDRGSGTRNRREDGVARLLCELTGAAAATVVNNNAGATLLALAALAAGREVPVARGQLVEIGGSFRIPEVMAQSGAKLVEVGATNKVHLRDYEAALNSETALLLKVHASNFKIVGFTKEVPVEELVTLGREHGIPVMDDLGSGSLIDLSRFGLEPEPLIQHSIGSGAGVVCFSGDKLLGGPQAGIIVGDEDLIERIQFHPLYRSLRPDKLTLAALEAVLQLYRDPETALREIPVLAMLTGPVNRLEERAEAIVGQLSIAAEVSITEEISRVGGGAYAVATLPTRAVAIAPKQGSIDEIARRLRLNDPPIFVRRKEERLLLDLRSVAPEQDAALAAALNALLGA